MHAVGAWKWKLSAILMLSRATTAYEHLHLHICKMFWIVLV